MVNRRTLDPFRRAAIAAGAAATAVFLLAGCGAGGGETETGPEPAGFDDLQSATVYIKGQGTFIDPGSLDPAEGRWIGSGFVVSEDGLVVTNNHVVTGAGALDVLIGGEDEVGGKVLGASECLDLAVIQLDEGGEYSFLAWHEGEIKTGLDVYSAGYPLGAAEEFTLTRGIVSKDDFPLDTQWASLEHVIEHDARIRGGNSGGPLVDEDGAVVGVNYAGDDSLDYNFAIHRDVVQEHLDDLAAGERVQSIGINAQAWVSEDGSLYGVWVQSVEAGGPADAAGIEPGDLIFSLAGVTVGDDGTLGAYCQVLDTQGSDATIDIQVYRPASDELLEGQINGDELSVVQSGYLGGDVPDDGGFQNVTDDAGVLNVSGPRRVVAGGRCGLHRRQRNRVVLPLRGPRPQRLLAVVHRVGGAVHGRGRYGSVGRGSARVALRLVRLGVLARRGGATVRRRRVLRGRLLGVGLLGHCRDRGLDSGCHGEQRRPHSAAQRRVYDVSPVRVLSTFYFQP